MLRDRFEAHVASGRVTHLPRHSVWSVEHDGLSCVIRAVEGERERHQHTERARSVILATGALDRHVPFPGWTLPGVMAAGGAQALLKGSRVATGQRAVVAGTGPFLFPVADGLLAAGAEVAEVLEANQPWRMAAHPGAVPAAAAKLPELIGYGRQLLRSGVPYRMGHAVIAAHGDGRLQTVTVARLDSSWRVVSGTERRVECDLLAGVYAAGETTGVGGSDLAIVEGRLCGSAVARDLPDLLSGGDQVGRVGRERLRRRARSLRRFAAALHEVHPVKDGWTGWLEDETLVCRCEEVPYARVRAAMDDLGAGDARTVKLLARPGMGWCQGRICRSAIATLAAGHRGDSSSSSFEDLTAMSRRTLGQPVPLSQLASSALYPSAGCDDEPDRID